MIKMVKYFIEQSWLLIVSGFVFGLLLAVTNAAWAPRIEANKTAKLNRLMNSLIANADFELASADVEIKLDKGKTATSNIYKAATADGSCGGFCFNAVGAGFADKVELVIAVDADCQKIRGYQVLFSNETPGFGTKIAEEYYRLQFIGAPVGQLQINKKGDSKIIDDEIIAISGATISSTAVVNIFNTYLEQIKTKLIAEGILQ